MMILCKDGDRGDEVGMEMMELDTGYEEVNIHDFLRPVHLTINFNKFHVTSTIRLLLNCSRHANSMILSALS